MPEHETAHTMLDPAPRHTVNQIEVVGRLVAHDGRSGPAVVQPHAGAARYHAYGPRLRMQVVEEDDLVYTLPIDLMLGDPAQQALVDTLQVGDRVQIGGRLRAERTFDRRFATAGHPEGRPTMQLTVVVAQLVSAPPDAVDGSWVQLVGRISVPPAIRHHEHLPDEQVARTSLVVEWHEPSRRPGSRFQISRIDRIPLDIPLSVDGSSAALRTGNRVCVEGRLEPFQRPLRPQTNRIVAEHLDELQARWQAEQATLRAAERDQRQRQYLQTLRRLQQEQRLRVRAGYIELLDGQPMTLTEARE